jgi:hypothetical protein
MQRLVLFAFFISAASAGPIVVGPIDIHGFGSYEWQSGNGWVIHFSASGASGSDTVSFDTVAVFDANEVPGPIFPGLPDYFTAPPECFWVGSASIDGIFGSCNVPNAQFSIGGTGTLVLFDLMGNVVATASLIAPLTFYNEVDTFNGNQLVQVTADFTVGSEPNDAVIMGVGLGTLLFAILNRKLRFPSGLSAKNL